MRYCISIVIVFNKKKNTNTKISTRVLSIFSEDFFCDIVDILLQYFAIGLFIGLHLVGFSKQFPFLFTFSSGL